MSTDGETQNLEIQLLAVRCQLGEAAAIDELVARMHLRLWAYLIRLIGQKPAAEDALQETWLRALRELPRLRDPARLESWIFGIARHVAIDSLRRRRITVDPSELSAAELQVLPTADPEGDELAVRWAELEAELLALPFVEREVLTLFYLEELSQNQIAEVLGVPVGTVKSRLFRARRLLLDRSRSKEKGN